jgi:phage shock protein PspC (stress-responsive transcriptional regulator)
MKKIININLSGRVIPIEDAAYESLQKYIESLRRYFAHEEGRDEIINDIESRIAELMNDKIRKGQAAITEVDIEEIITAMGRVQDFEQAEEKENFSSASQAQAEFSGAQTTRIKGRLYRDGSDKLVGGVCSGIANYMNMDPTVVRLLFAIITFGGFGFGFLIYLLLWIILPAKNLDVYVGKRLFRNPDDKIIGGVASGLAAYFKKTPNTIRLIFAAPLILNIALSMLNFMFSSFHGVMFPGFFVGSITGTFLLIYIVLWIVLPEARSPFEKMEMRGETVDVNRIRQNVKDEMENFKSRAEAWGEEVKTSAKEFSEKAKTFANTRGKEFASEFSSTARPVASGIGHAIGVIIKAFFIFVAGSIAFALFVALIVLLFGGSSAFWPGKSSVLNFILDGFWEKAFFWGTVIFFVLVPLVAFITWLVRRIMKVRTQKSYLGWIFTALWTIGWISLMLLVSNIFRDFRFSREASTIIPLQQPADNRLIVNVLEPEVRYNGGLWFVNDDEGGWDITEDSLKLTDVNIRIEKSMDSTYSVNLVKQSRGRTGSEAVDRALKIQYSLSQSGNVISLGSGYGISKNEKFRAQDVRLEIRIPVGKKINFDQSVMEKLHPLNVRIAERKRNKGNRDYDFRIEEDRYMFNYKTNVDYIMTITGELEEANKLPETTEPATKNTDSINNIIREKEREIEILKQQRSTRTIIKKQIETRTITIADMGRPFFSVLI